jgi:hypothetical protein
VLLDRYIDRCREKHFSWSSWNCVHFARGWVFEWEKELIEFPISFERAGVSTALAAARYARSLGGIPNIVTEALRRDPSPPTFASVGDLVYFGDAAFAGTLGICNGRTAFALSTGAGVVAVPATMFKLAWKLRCAGV